MGTSKTTNNVEALSSVRETFVSGQERWFCTYVTATLVSVYDCYVEQALDCVRIDLLQVEREV